MSVAEYAANLESLAKHFRYFQGRMDEGYMCERFIDGLNYELQRAVQPLSLNQYQLLVEKTKGIEAIDQARNRYQGYSKPQQGGGGPVRNGHGRRDTGKLQQKKPYHKHHHHAQNRGATYRYSYPSRGFS